MSKKTALRLCFDVVMALGAVACILQWLGIKPEDLHMTLTGPHVLWLLAGLVLFGVSLWSSLRSGFWQARQIVELKERASEVADAHREEINKLETSHQSEMFRANQIRDQYKTERDQALDEVLALSAQSQSGKYQTEALPSRPRLLSCEGMGTMDGCYALMSGSHSFYFLKIRNSEFANPVTAYTVRAKISYKHANNSDGFIVSEAFWMPTPNQQFPRRVSIESNTEAHLIFISEMKVRIKPWVQGMSDPGIDTRWGVATDLPSGDHIELKPGHWSVTVEITADNCAPYTGVGGFTISPRDYEFRLDQNFPFTYTGEEKSEA